MVFLGIVMPVRAAARSPSRRPIWRVRIDKLVSGEPVAPEKVFRLASDKCEPRIEMTRKFTNHLRVAVNADVKLCGNFVPQHCSTTQVRLNVNPMPRHQVYQLLKTTELSARI